MLLKLIHLPGLCCDSSRSAQTERIGEAGFSTVAAAVTTVPVGQCLFPSQKNVLMLLLQGALSETIYLHASLPFVRCFVIHAVML
jgi:hypothetical protein